MRSSCKSSIKRLAIPIIWSHLVEVRIIISLFLIFSDRRLPTLMLRAALAQAKPFLRFAPESLLSLRALIVPSLTFGWRSSLRCGGKRRVAPALIFCSLLGGRRDAESRLPKGSRAARALALRRLSSVYLVLPKPLRPAFITLRLTGLLPLPPAPLRGELLRLNGRRFAAKLETQT